MAKNPRTVPIADLRQDASAVLSRVKKSARPLVITERGRAAAVRLTPAAYRRSEHERQLLRLLARGEREIKKGRGYDLDSVLADADRLLARKS